MMPQDLRKEGVTTMSNAADKTSERTEVMSCDPTNKNGFLQSTRTCYKTTAAPVSCKTGGAGWRRAFGSYKRRKSFLSKKEFEDQSLW